jgi:hypothetical protein
MPTKHVTLSKPKVLPGTREGYAIRGEDTRRSAPRDYLVDPKILIITGVAMIFFLFSMLYDSTPARLTPFLTLAKQEKVMEREVTVLRETHKIDAAELDQLTKAIEKQMQNVSQAEAVGDKARAKQEITKLMYITGGHADSPLYKFCVSRLKEYE